MLPNGFNVMNSSGISVDVTLMGPKQEFVLEDDARILFYSKQALISEGSKAITHYCPGRGWIDKNHPRIAIDTTPSDCQSIMCKLIPRPAVEAAST